MHIPACLAAGVGFRHDKRRASALRFDPFAVLRCMDRKYLHYHFFAFSPISTNRRMASERSIFRP